MSSYSVTRSGLSTLAVICGVVAGFVTGCSRSSQESQVSGRVLLDGNRIGPGTVVFDPVGDGKPAIGPIDASGYYNMKTSRETGLGAGKYKVAVSVREQPAVINRGDRAPPGKLLIPEKYEDSATSGLEYEVAPGSNTINIELKNQSTKATVLSAGLRLCEAAQDLNNCWVARREALRKA